MDDELSSEEIKEWFDSLQQCFIDEKVEITLNRYYQKEDYTEWKIHGNCQRRMFHCFDITYTYPYPNPNDFDSDLIIRYKLMSIFKDFCKNSTFTSPYYSKTNMIICCPGKKTIKERIDHINEKIQMLEKEKMSLTSNYFCEQINDDRNIILK